MLSADNIGQSLLPANSNQPDKTPSSGADQPKSPSMEESLTDNADDHHEDENENKSHHSDSTHILDLLPSELRNNTSKRFVQKLKRAQALNHDIASRKFKTTLILAPSQNLAV